MIPILFIGNLSLDIISKIRCQFWFLLLILWIEKSYAGSPIIISGPCVKNYFYYENYASYKCIDGVKVLQNCVPMNEPNSQAIAINSTLITTHFRSICVQYDANNVQFMRTHCVDNMDEMPKFMKPGTENDYPNLKIICRFNTTIQTLERVIKIKKKRKVCRHKKDKKIISDVLYKCNRNAYVPSQCHGKNYEGKAMVAKIGKEVADGANYLYICERIGKRYLEVTNTTLTVTKTSHAVKQRMVDEVVFRRKKCLHYEKKGKYTEIDVDRKDLVLADGTRIKCTNKTGFVEKIVQTIEVRHIKSKKGCADPLNSENEIKVGDKYSFNGNVYKCESNLTLRLIGCTSSTGKSLRFNETSGDPLGDMYQICHGEKGLITYFEGDCVFEDIKIKQGRDHIVSTNYGLNIRLTCERQMLSELNWNITEKKYWNLLIFKDCVDESKMSVPIDGIKPSSNSRNKNGKAEVIEYCMMESGGLFGIGYANAIACHYLDKVYQFNETFISGYDEHLCHLNGKIKKIGCYISSKKLKVRLGEVINIGEETYLQCEEKATGFVVTNRPKKCVTEMDEEATFGTTYEDSHSIKVCSRNQSTGPVVGVWRLTHCVFGTIKVKKGECFYAFNKYQRCDEDETHEPIYRPADYESCSPEKEVIITNSKGAVVDKIVAQLTRDIFESTSWVGVEVTETKHDKKVETDEYSEEYPNNGEEDEDETEETTSEKQIESTHEQNDTEDTKHVIGSENTSVSERNNVAHSAKDNSKGTTRDESTAVHTTSSQENENDSKEYRKYGNTKKHGALNDEFGKRHKNGSFVRIVEQDNDKQHDSFEENVADTKEDEQNYHNKVSKVHHKNGSFVHKSDRYEHSNQDVTEEVVEDANQANKHKKNTKTSSGHSTEITSRGENVVKDYDTNGKTRETDEGSEQGSGHQEQNSFEESRSLETETTDLPVLRNTWVTARAKNSEENKIDLSKKSISVDDHETDENSESAETPGIDDNSKTVDGEHSKDIEDHRTATEKYDDSSDITQEDNTPEIPENDQAPGEDERNNAHDLLHITTPEPDLSTDEEKSSSADRNNDSVETRKSEQEDIEKESHANDSNESKNTETTTDKGRENPNRSKGASDIINDDSSESIETTNQTEQPDSDSKEAHSELSVEKTTNAEQRVEDSKSTGEVDVRSPHIPDDSKAHVVDEPTTESLEVPSGSIEEPSEEITFTIKPDQSKHNSGGIIETDEPETSSEELTTDSSILDEAKEKRKEPYPSDDTLATEADKSGDENQSLETTDKSVDSGDNTSENLEPNDINAPQEKETNGAMPTENLSEEKPDPTSSSDVSVQVIIHVRNKSHDAKPKKDQENEPGKHDESSSSEEPTEFPVDNSETIEEQKESTEPPTEENSMEEPLNSSAQKNAEEDRNGGENEPLIPDKSLTNSDDLSVEPKEPSEENSMEEPKEKPGFSIENKEPESGPSKESYENPDVIPHPDIPSEIEDSLTQSTQPSQTIVTQAPGKSIKSSEETEEQENPDDSGLDSPEREDQITTKPETAPIIPPTENLEEKEPNSSEPDIPRISEEKSAQVDDSKYIKTTVTTDNSESEESDELPVKKLTTEVYVTDASENKPKSSEPASHERPAENSRQKEVREHKSPESHDSSDTKEHSEQKDAHNEPSSEQPTNPDVSVHKEVHTTKPKSSEPIDSSDESKRPETSDESTPEKTPHPDISVDKEVHITKPKSAEPNDSSDESKRPETSDESSPEKRANPDVSVHKEVHITKPKSAEPNDSSEDSKRPETSDESPSENPGADDASIETDTDVQKPESSDLKDSSNSKEVSIRTEAPSEPEVTTEEVDDIEPTSYLDDQRNHESDELETEEPEHISESSSENPSREQTEITINRTYNIEPGKKIIIHHEQQNVHNSEVDVSGSYEIVTQILSGEIREGEVDEVRNLTMKETITHGSGEVPPEDKHGVPPDEAQRHNKPGTPPDVKEEKNEKEPEKPVKIPKRPDNDNTEEKLKDLINVEIEHQGSYGEGTYIVKRRKSTGCSDFLGKLGHRDCAQGKSEEEFSIYGSQGSSMEIIHEKKLVCENKLSNEVCEAFKAMCLPISATVRVVRYVRDFIDPKDDDIHSQLQYIESILPDYVKNKPTMKKGLKKLNEILPYIDCKSLLLKLLLDPYGEEFLEEILSTKSEHELYCGSLRRKCSKHKSLDRHSLRSRLYCKRFNFHCSGTNYSLRRYFVSTLKDYELGKSVEKVRVPNTNERISELCKKTCQRCLNSDDLFDDEVDESPCSLSSN